MKLKSFGCSFIFGTGLADVSDIVNASKSTWPALLANHLGYAYECHARPGTGNLQILEQILNQVSANNNNLFIIGWTWVDRFDYYNPDHGGKTWNDWSTLRPGDTSTAATTYFKELHSEYRDKFTSLTCIKLAIDTLKQKDIPFIMTYMDELLFDQQWHTSPAIAELQNYIQPHMTKFNGQSFLEWSRANKYPETVDWHPLEPAHQSAFELIKNQSFL